MYAQGQKFGKAFLTNSFGLMRKVNESNVETDETVEAVLLSSSDQ